MNKTKTYINIKRKKRKEKLANFKRIKTQYIINKFNQSLVTPWRDQEKRGLNPNDAFPLLMLFHYTKENCEKIKGLQGTKSLLIASKKAGTANYLRLERDPDKNLSRDQDVITRLHPTLALCRLNPLAESIDKKNKKNNKNNKVNLARLNLYCLGAFYKDQTLSYLDVKEFLDLQSQSNGGAGQGRNPASNLINDLNRFCNPLGLTRQIEMVINLLALIASKKGEAEIPDSNKVSTSQDLI